MQTIESIYFTVYKTKKAIELRPGCQDYRAYQVVGTCRDYSRAFQMAEACARVSHLPMIDYLLPRF